MTPNRDAHGEGGQNPLSSLPPAEQNRRILRLLRPYALPFLALSSVSALVSMMNGASQLALTPLLEIVINNGLPPDFEQQAFTFDLNHIGQSILAITARLTGFRETWPLLVTTSITFLLLMVTQQALDFGMKVWSNNLRLQIMRDIQHHVYVHLLSLPISFLKKHQVGWLQSRIVRDIQSALLTVRGVLVDGLGNIILAGFYLFLLVRTDPRLTLVAAAAGIIQLALSRLLARYAEDRIRIETHLSARVGATVIERLAAIRVIKAFAAEEFESRHMWKRMGDYQEASQRMFFYQAILPPTRFIVNRTIIVAVMLFGAWQLLNGRLTVPAFLLFMFFAQSTIAPLTRLAEVVLQTTEIRALLEGSLYILEQTPEQSGARRLPTDGFTDCIALKGVSFGYEDMAVLQDIDLTIRRGEMVALVGKSGAGKSTLVDLLLRYYEPDSGTITLDGVPIHEFDISDYRRLFGTVSQDNVLFSDTVYNNIAYGRPDLQDEDVRAAARIANAEPFILNDLGDRYDTLLGERGVRLSGGQRQRVAIARAVVQRPPILILDEATSALDSESERLVQRAIDQVIEGSTAVVIAHRLSTILRADKIVVLKAGRIVEVGTHAELLEKDGEYRSLYDIQFRPAEAGGPNGQTLARDLVSFDKKRGSA